MGRITWAFLQQMGNGPRKGQRTILLRSLNKCLAYTLALSRRSSDWRRRYPIMSSTSTSIITNFSLTQKSLREKWCSSISMRPIRVKSSLKKRGISTPMKQDKKNSLTREENHSRWREYNLMNMTLSQEIRSFPKLPIPIKARRPWITRLLNIALCLYFQIQWPRLNCQMVYKTRPLSISMLNPLGNINPNLSLKTIRLSAPITRL